MNLLLLHGEDFITEDRVLVNDRRAEHIRTILKAKPGDTVKAGRAGGLMGEAVIESDAPDGISLRVNLSEAPPEPLPVTLLLAMPRPIAFRRMLPWITAFGVKNIHLFNAFKVEKSYWTSSVFGEFQELMTLGLEQARDTVYPEITQHQRFKIFAEDEVPGIIAGTLPLVAHPGSGEVCPAAVAGAVTVCIGPEGGFTDYEIELLIKQGFRAVGLGARILRSETAVPAILGRLLT
jgi:RsmE family RNA methyltransferase